MSTSDYTVSGITIMDPIEWSDWECQLFGGTTHGLVWRPVKGDEPNWFWRWMQFIAFGNRWRLRPESEARSP